METSVIITLLIIACVLLAVAVVLFLKIIDVLRKTSTTNMLVIEAIGKLTRAQKSCLSYLQTIEQELKPSEPT